MSTDRPVENILPRLNRVRQQRGKPKWRAECPLCHSRSALSITELPNGGVIAKCFACNTTSGKGDFAAALGLEPRDFFPKENRLGWRTEIARYVYTDADGVVLYEKIRFANKTFAFVGPDGATPGLPDGTPHVLYRLPEVVEAIARGERIYVVEGEKDVETLRRIGLFATTSDGGAASTWSRDDVEVFASAPDVVVLPDNDPPGRDYAERVANQLLAVNAGVRVVMLGGLPPKGDVTDWIAAGHDGALLQAIAHLSPNWTLGDRVPPSDKISEACAFLRQQLRWSPVPATIVRAASKGAGISLRTLDRAKKALGVESFSERRSNGTRGIWYWYLPESVAVETDTGGERDEVSLERGSEEHDRTALLTA